MEMLRDMVRNLEATVSNDRKQLQELRGNYDQTEQDLLRTKEQLQGSDDMAQQLANDLHSKQGVESTNQMLESRLDQLEHELMTSLTEEMKYRNQVTDLNEQLFDKQSSSENSKKAHAEIAALRQQLETLELEKEKELNDLRAQLTKVDDLSSLAASEREEAMNQELNKVQDQMSKKIEALEREKEAYSSFASAREEKFEQELCSLQGHIEQKDEQISTLKNELDSHEKDLYQLKLEADKKTRKYRRAYDRVGKYEICSR
jgi:chromosome segregation ATPase